MQEKIIDDSAREMINFLANLDALIKNKYSKKEPCIAPEKKLPEQSKSNNLISKNKGCK